MEFVRNEVNTKGLFTTCFDMSERKRIIRTSHLPFEDGYYVTEYNVVLKVHNHTIYVLTEMGWEQNQNFYKLWYDGMTDFADISPKLVEELGLDKENVVKASVENKTKAAELLTEGTTNATKPLINMTDMPDCNEFATDTCLVEDCEFMKSFYNLHKEKHAECLGGYYASQES